MCLAIRLVNYAVITASALFVLLGSKGYAGSDDALLRWLPLLPIGPAGGLILTVITDCALAVSFSAVQVRLYRRALNDWSARIIVDALPLRCHPRSEGAPKWTRCGMTLSALGGLARSRLVWGDHPEPEPAEELRYRVRGRGRHGVGWVAAWRLVQLRARLSFSVLFSLHPLVFDPNRCG